MKSDKKKIHIIIGHRGTGKTRWLKIISELYRNSGQKVLCFDLDRVVESLSGQTVCELFKKGERVFRTWEKKAFSEILSRLSTSEKIFIAAGAGFRFVKNPHWRVIHLGRPSDSQGRLFPVSRPRLNPRGNPFEEYKLYYSLRKARYRRQADEVFIRREYFKEAHISDSLFLGLKRLKPDIFSLTLNPRLFPTNKDHWENFLKRRLHWGIRFFELNDKTSSSDFVNRIRFLLPEEKLLFTSQKDDSYRAIKNKLHWCWDVSLGHPPKGVNILSLHKRSGKSLKTVIKDFSKHKGFHLKLAPLIYNFEELWEGFRWQQEDRKNRSFLPRSGEGRWKWFRLAFGPQSKLYFIREGEWGVKDQPLFSEAVHFTGKAKGLAGVIGHPVEASATPWEQNDFFTVKRDIPVFPVALGREEMTKKNLEILKNLGFVFFAVTSPLKEEAFYCVESPSRELKTFKSLNTLILHNGKWKGYNTDVKGFSLLKQQFIKKKTVVWGGGGIRRPLKALLPEASFYSARKRKPVYGRNLSKPEVLIWGVGRQAMEKGCHFPPKAWKPTLVLDINYGENSPGLEYAMSLGAEYKNGWEVFKKQAAKQRTLFATLENQR